MNKKWTFLLFLGLLFTTYSVWAVKVGSLYQADIPVRSQAIEERKQAMQKALEQVLIKVSGNNQIITDPRIKLHLRNAESVVQEFGYVRPALTDASAPYLLQIRFDANSINHWLRDANAPIWGQNRPLVLGWIATETPEHTTEIMYRHSRDALAELLKQNSYRRGIPFNLPTKNPSAEPVPVEDIIQFSSQNAIKATKPYNSGAILMGYVVEKPNNITTQWKLISEKGEWDWNINGTNLASVTPVIMDHVANTLAAQYAVVISNTIQKNVALQVVGINQQGDFTQLIRYLNHLTPVANVGIVRITSHDILLNISLRSTQQSFIQVISLGGKLTPIANEIGTSPLIYQWNPSHANLE